MSRASHVPSVLFFTSVPVRVTSYSWCVRVNMCALSFFAATDPMAAQCVRTASAARWRGLDLPQRTTICRERTTVAGRLALFTFVRNGSDAPDVRARCPPVDRAALRAWYAAAWREVRG